MRCSYKAVSIGGLKSANLSSLGGARNGALTNSTPGTIVELSECNATRNSVLSTLPGLLDNTRAKVVFTGTGKKIRISIRIKYKNT